MVHFFSPQSVLHYSTVDSVPVIQNLNSLKKKKSAEQNKCFRSRPFEIWITSDQMYGFILCSSVLCCSRCCSLFFPFTFYNKSLSASVVYAAMLFCCEAPEMFCDLYDFPPGEELMIKMFMFGWMFPLNILLVIGKKRNYISPVVNATIPKHKTMATKDKWGFHCGKDRIFNKYYGYNLRAETDPRVLSKHLWGFHLNTCVRPLQ